MTNKAAADELQYAINLIKQNGKDWLDERDIPILKAAISALQAQEAKHSMPSAEPEQAVKDCRNCKHGNYNDHWETHFCYNPNECTEWNLWEPITQPERKTGRWLIREGISDAQCSECKMYFRDVYDMENSDAFCRHCGAKMEGLKVVKDE